MKTQTNIDKLKNKLEKNFKNSDRMDIDDAFQEAFLMLFDKYPEQQNNPAEKLNYWLYKTALNILRKNLRQKRKFSKIHIETDIENIAENGTLYDLIENEFPESIFDVDRYIKELSPPLQEVIELHYTKGYNFVQIAKILDKKPCTIWKRHERALIKLRDKLKKIIFVLI